MVIAKYNVAFREQGILFMSICPGSVDTAAQGGEHGKPLFRFKMAEKY